MMKEIIEFSKNVIEEEGFYPGLGVESLFLKSMGKRPSSGYDCSK